MSDIIKYRPKTDIITQKDLLGRIIKSECTCGEVIHIEHDSPDTLRTDGKRIFYPFDEPEMKGCLLTCHYCFQPVMQSVPGAEYGKNEAYK